MELPRTLRGCAALKPMASTATPDGITSDDKAPVQRALILSVPADAAPAAFSNRSCLPLTIACPRAAFIAGVISWPISTDTGIPPVTVPFADKCPPIIIVPDFPAATEDCVEERSRFRLFELETIDAEAGLELTCRGIGATGTVAAMVLRGKH